MSMWLHKETWARCYMLSARELFIVWGGTPQYWSRTPLTDSRDSALSRSYKRRRLMQNSYM